MLPRWIRPIFIFAAVYDLLLGIAVMLFQGQIFTWYGVEPPNHPGYVAFGAAVVIIFGIGFALVARAPQRNCDLIGLGVLFKLAYAGTVLHYHFTIGIPSMWVPWAYADLLFAVLFILALRALPATAD